MPANRNDRVSVSQPESKVARGGGPFSIVGVGTSAGGLEALEQFFAGVPKNSGMAFVVVQHLDPDRHGLLPELLQRATPMLVQQAGNRMKTRPDCVYVIPPNKDLVILHDTLYLLDRLAPHGLRLPIDSFFRSLAEDRREHAIGVILSGMGSDGTLGLRAIKEQGGLALVQDPAEAKFDGMPRSAIEAGYADVVAGAGELTTRIVNILGQLPSTGENLPESVTNENSSAFEKVCILLRSHTRHDFSLYKKSTIYRRIERRMGIHQLRQISDYVHFLQENPQEIDLLFKELLIGVTHFFRDPAAWAYLQESVLPAMIAAKQEGGMLRAWVAGCSTGEEAYSLAITFKELVERLKPLERVVVQIFATDLDPDAIAKARKGYFPANIAADLSPERLTRFFREAGSGFRVAEEIRQMVVFATQNVVMDPPFTKLDIVTCRNLLIYLGPDLQKKLLRLFHYSLNPGGALFLGSAESIGGFHDLFSSLDSKARIYRSEQVVSSPLDVDFPTPRFNAPVNLNPALIHEMHVPNLQALADQLLLQKFSPAAVLVNANGDVLFINGRTGEYLEPAAGKANWNIHAMAREGLREELAIALPKALRAMEAVAVKDLQVGSNSGVRRIDLTVYPVREPAPLKGMAMIVFAEVTAPVAKPKRRPGKLADNGRILELEAALQQAAAEIQTIREDMQRSHEELKSANEELQSTNEELQLTNEELTTSKEEMQSLNEELQTVNAELQSKVDELSLTNNDMKNLLNSTDIATIFLDNGLRVRRYTDQATRIFKLIPGDVGRPLADIVTELDYPDLQKDIKAVLDTLIFSEKQIAGPGGNWHVVKILPYRTQDNVIDGVVITFIDISVAKKLEAELRAARGTGSST